MKIFLLTYNTTLIKKAKTILFLFFLLVTCQFVLAQPGNMSINQDISGIYTNTIMTLKGDVYQARFQEDGVGTPSNTRNWQFNSDGYNNTWGAISSNTLASYNSSIAPNTGTASGNWVVGGYNAFGKLPATQANYYYTYNIIKGSSYSSQLISVLETSFNPTTINSVVNTVGTYGSRIITITTGSTPDVGENIFVRYSTDGYVTSTLVQATGSTTTWAATIPWKTSAVNYYVYSSNRSLATINADVAANGQSAHDTSMLNLNNNGGANYSWIPVTGNFIVTSAGGTTFNNGVGYASLTLAGEAFAALNGASASTGAVTILATGDSVSEDGATSLNASANWTSIAMHSYGNRTISGNPTGGTPLINLNGADNVTIDGLNDGTNSLSIANTTVSATDGTSTIRFIGDASNNTIQNCIIKGSETSTASGTIFFSTGTTTGNINNTITNNTITSAGNNLPVNAIYSSGTSVGVNNSGNTVSNNNIQDYFSATISSNGIYLAANSASWTITENNFFQTAIRTTTANSVTYRGIYINTTQGGYTISNNVIGYANAGSTGITTIAGNFTNAFKGIELAGNTTVSNIQGNTISGINFSTTTSPFYGINITAGAVNIGTTTGNIIGSPMETNTIVVTATSLVDIYGIFITSLGTTATIQNNSIGGISTGGGATIGYQFTGVYFSGTSSFTIDNNTIGSTANINSIVMGTSGITTSGICRFIGITNASNGTNSITNNNILHFSVYGTSTSFFYGIYLPGSGITTVNYNTISDISLTGTGTPKGIYHNGSATTLFINNNIIKNIVLSATTVSFTAIENAGTITTSITINNNQLGNASGGLVNYTAANNQIFNGILNSVGAATATLTIQGNDFRGITHSVTGSSVHNYILNSAATLSQDISNNTFTNLNVATSGNVTFISNNVVLGATGTQVVSGNSIVGTFNKSVAGGTVTVFTKNATASNIAANITNSNNNFSNITVTGATTLTGWSNLDSGLNAKIFNGNTFSNWTAGTETITVMTLDGFGTGSSISNNTIATIAGQSTITGINIVSTGNAVLPIANNTITGLSSTGIGGNVTGLTSSNSAGINNISTNTINTLSSTGALAIVSGLQSSGGQTTNIYSNSINTLSGTGSSSTINGIYVSAGATINAYSNTINTITSTGTSAIINGIKVSAGTTINAYSNTINTIVGTGTLAPVANGISVSFGTTVNLYKNKIYDIAENGTNSGATVNGLSFTNTFPTTLTAHNNIIGDLKAPNTNNVLAVKGINVNSTAINTTYKLYYNTIYLDASSTGTNFGTAGIYHAENGTTSRNNLTQKNNIVINKSSPSGTGKTVASYRSSYWADNYDTTSNNNLFFAGTPSGSNLIYFEGTNNFPLLVNFQAAVTPRELNSVSEDVAFLSVTPTDIDYLKPNTAPPTYIESTGVNVAGITDDYVATIRQGNGGYAGTGTAPDLGAYEIDGIAKIGNVTVSGAISGNGNYATLYNAFANINAGVQTGANIIVTINSDTNESTVTDVLNAGTWASLRVIPNGTRIITGSTTGGNPLINLNGADNVTIDGLNDGTNSLTISNTTISGTATIKLIGDASNNTIQNCTIKGSGTTATSGTIFFSTGTATGNINNTITNNTITLAGSNLPLNAIYSSGTLAKGNDTNTISNNNIQDYFNATISSNGICLAANSASWTITGNKFFQTATRTTTANNVTYRGIYINTTQGGYTISNNVIGYANAGSTGITTIAGNFTNTFTGIELAGNTTVSNIQENTISGINFSTTTSPFYGINITAGAVNIGTTSGNIIGSSIANNTIVITPTSNATIYGIQINSSGATANVQNNTIGGINASSGATISTSIFGLFTAGNSNFSISNNTIGSSTILDSIISGINGFTTASNTVMGIYDNASGIVSITNNNILNCSSYGTGGGTVLNGISLGSGTSPKDVSNNTISNLNSMGNLRGISTSAAVSTINISNNILKNFVLFGDKVFTGIGNFTPGAVTTAININNNQLGTASEGLVTFNVANSNVNYGIYNQAGSSTAALTIQGNDFRGIDFSAASSSNLYCIFNSANTLSQNISNNTFTNLTANTTGSITFISDDVVLGAAGSQVVSGNSIVGTFNKSLAGGTVTVFFGTAGNHNATSTITNSNNNFSNITLTGATSINGWHIPNNSIIAKTITNNTFNNWTTGTGTITVINISGFGTGSSVSNNTISSITGQGNITGLFINSSGNATILPIANNTITGLSSTGTGGDVTGLISFSNAIINNVDANTIHTLSSTGFSTTVLGIQVSGGTGTTNAYSNTVNTLSSTGASSTVSGIQVSGGTTVNMFSNALNTITSTGISATINGIDISGGTTVNTYSNTINTITGTGTTSPIANGIFVSGGTTVNLYKNKIYDIAENGTNSGATVNGLSFTNALAATVSAYNNIIGDLKAPATSLNFPITGIKINSGASTSYKLYYNTIYLAGTSSNTNFGAIGIYHNANATSTTANLTMNNNVIVNTVAAKGTGKTIAFYRTAATLGNYSSTSNRNLFYAGTSGINNLIYYDGTNSDQQLVDLQSRVTSRELNSVSEDVAFLSVTPTDVDYLKPSTVSPTYIESTGVNIAGITDDYIATIRQDNGGYINTGGTAPDLGAYEIAGTAKLSAVVTVSGAISGNGNYATLYNAFANINAGVQTGANIIVTINSDTNESTVTDVLNAGTWTSLSVVPNGNRTITGTTTAGNTLINLNGADNVTVDGLNDGTNSLTIANTTVSATDGTSTIRFIGDASNNTIQNCIIKGSETSSTASGTIFFSTAGTTTGNINNTITNNTITSAGSNLPINAIYSSGTATKGNDNNTISNNNIQDYFSATSSSNGIYLAANSASWTITGNKFFQTATRTTTANLLSYRGIYISTLQGGYTIDNNIIGYANASGTGTTTIAGNFTNTFKGILLNGNSTVSSIQGNIISGINFSTSYASLVGSSGISVTAGAVNIGTITGNTIGSSTGNNAIVITSTSGDPTIYGIDVTSSTAPTVTIQNNSIGGIYTSVGPAINFTFYGISISGTSAFNVINNIVGSISTANSITIGTSGVTTSGNCSFLGIYNRANGNTTITNNSIMNCSTYGTLGNSYLYGIVNAAAAGNTIDVNSNILSDLNTAMEFRGIYSTAGGTTLNMNNNILKKLSLSKNAAFIGLGVLSGGGFITSAININNNQLGTPSEGLVTFNVANSNTIYGIFNQLTTVALTIQGNDFRGFIFSVPSTSNVNYICNSSSTTSQNIINNTFTNLTANTSGNLTFISNDTVLAPFGSQVVSGNNIVGTFSKSVAGGTLKIFSFDGNNSSPSATITNTNNNFSNISVTGATTITGWSNMDTGNTLKTITGNTFSNWTAGTGAITVMRFQGFGTGSSVSNNTIAAIAGQSTINGINIGSIGNAATLAVANNTITGLSSTGTGGDVIGLITANTAVINNISANTINTLSSTGSLNTVSGLQVSGGATINVYSNILNTITSTGGSAIINGIYVSDGTTINAYSNTINTIAGTGITAPVANGISVSAGTIVNLYKNKIYDIAENGISSGATVNGLSFTSPPTSTTVSAYNNIIGDLKAPNTNNTLAVKGIIVNTSNVNTTYKLYYNTIYLNATSTRANFGTAGIYHTANASSSKGNLIMNNNIFDNKSVANGIGKTVAYQRSITTLNNYDTTSDKNLFYGGTPSLTNLIFYDGTNSDQTLATFKTRVSTKETNSITGNPIFLSTSGSSTDFLHIDPTDYTGIESGGLSIAGYTIDYDGDTRNVTTPDIGADEGTFKKPIITSLATTAGCEGSSLVINGTNMQWVTVATIGGTAATITGQTATTLTVTVGSGTTGTVSVTSSGGTATSLQTFTIYPTSVGGTATVTGDLTICYNSQPSDITLSGHTGTVTNWQSSTHSDFSSGVINYANTTTTLTGTEIGNIIVTTYFRAVVQSGTCSSANSSNATISIISTTWNGSTWSNGTPTSISYGIIAGDYDTVTNPDITACSLTISSGTLTIRDTKFITIQNNLTVNIGATLEITNQGSLVMVSDIGVVTNNGTINVNKTTSPFEKYDYTYWSSPMVSSSIATTLPTWGNAYEFLPANFEDVNDDGFDDNEDDWLNATSMTPAKGYTIMGPTNEVFPRTESVTFTGRVNNGVVTTPIALTPNAIIDDDWNLVGNPYPSAIDANRFINTNIANISGTLYFWTHKNDISVSNPGPDSSNFSQDDYAMYNLTGGTATGATTGTGSNSGSTLPLGYISSCQGFFVEADNAAPLTFNNAMRVGLPFTANTQFFKTTAIKKKEIIKDRVWLNLQNNDGMFSQQLVGYLDNSSLNYDKGYDGLVNNGGNYISFYSFIDDTTYRIQSRGTFNENDQVNLGYFSAVAGTFNINIDNKEGVFMNSNAAIYIEDKMLNILYDLKKGPYNFTTDSGIFNNRFILRFTNKTLRSNDFSKQEIKVLVSNKDNLIKINSIDKAIEKVSIYNLLGKKIYQKNKINSNELVIVDLISAQQALIVKIILQDRQTVTTKIIYTGQR